MEAFANKLKELGKDCGYEGDLLERQLRDRFATGLNHQTLEIDLKQKWPDLQYTNNDGEPLEITFDQVFAVAQSRELAENDSTNNERVVNSIKRKQTYTKNKITRDYNVNKARKLTKDQCKRCGKYERHNSENCTAKNHSCEECDTRGHFESCCIKSGRAYLSFNRNKDNRPPTKRNVQRIKRQNNENSHSTVTSDKNSLTDSDEDDNNVYKVNVNNMRCKKIDIYINGHKCTMDWDPGSVYSIINTTFWESIGTPKLRKGPKLRAYCDYKLKPKGLTDVTVEVQGIQKILPVVVMRDANPMLFGLQWSEMFDMKFPSPVYALKTKTNKSLKEVINTNAELFDNKLGEVTNYEVNIHLKPGVTPRHLPARPIKFSMRKNVEAEIERLVKEGIIQQVDPNIIPVEWATPTVNVVKPNGKVRICGDYRITVNPALITHTYPVPQFDNLRQHLADGDKYSKIDLKDAYLQFKIAPESKKYLIISTHKGYFQYNRMPFGISTAPSIFQHYLEKLLEGTPNVAIYFDDIAITGKNDGEHLKTLYSVFQKLKQAGLKVNLQKCFFMKCEIEYLGHEINKHGIQPTKTKIEAILKAPAPSNTKELRSFLGLVNFYERFIPQLHSICADLHKLTGHRQKWKWTEHEHKIFEETKQRITKSKPLIAFNEKQKLFLACDASEKGVGAVLYHKRNNHEQPIAFASRKLKPAESKYSVIDREALAIFFGIKKFDQFVRGTKFTLVTDHKPLIHLLGTNRNLPKLVNNRLVRWALLIGSYDYEILYKKGENNWLADYLSRMPNPEEQPSQAELTVNRISEKIQSVKINDMSINENNIREYSKQDTLLSKVMQNIKTNWSSYHYDDNELKPYYRKRNELSIESKILMWQGRIIIPLSLRKTTLKYLHRGHPGISAMRALARFYVWWPSMEEDIDAYVKRCLKCQENRPNNPELPIYSWSIPDRVWERLHIDFAGPFQGKYWLVLCDALSKWIEIKPMNTTTADKLCNELNDIFTTFGLPEILVSDNGPQFTSHTFKTYCKNRNILHITSSPYHPRTNGLAERLVRTFKTRMSASENDQISIKERLQNFLFTYRNTPHNVTLKSPAHMMFGRQLRCILDNARPNTKKMLQHKQLQANIQAENQHKIPNHQQGDAVYIRTKQDSSWKPAVIIERTHKYSYTVKTPDGLEKRRHGDHIRPRNADKETGTEQTSPQFHTPTALSSSEHTPSSNGVGDLAADTAMGEQTGQASVETTKSTTPILSAPVPLRRTTRTIKPPRRLINEFG